jgi:hypothetical protein
MRIQSYQREPRPPTQEELMSWGLHNGHMRMFIYGPGLGTWFPVTSASSRNKTHGTTTEQSIAQKALKILSIRFHNSCAATPQDIREVLESCGWTPCEFTRYPGTQSTTNDQS